MNTKTHRIYWCEQGKSNASGITHQCANVDKHSVAQRTFGRPQLDVATFSISAERWTECAELRASKKQIFCISIRRHEYNMLLLGFDMCSDREVICMRRILITLLTVWMWSVTLIAPGGVDNKIAVERSDTIVWVLHFHRLLGFNWMPRVDITLEERD